MAKIIFSLKYVEEDEANDIRQLLMENEIEFYETTAGRWQISLAAIWIRNNEDFDKARALIEADQKERREAYQANMPDMRLLPSLWRQCRHNPVEFGFTLVAIVFVLGLTLWPFWLV
ncbi:MAG: DUF6164 family protein [Marinomonas sp.]|uniref:DUF6164 family protein n=1 Tax=unclassified Marinomonas TaxID=196814 RepID=UPI0005FA282C|nr:MULTISPECIES: DUF6164 family protein [unclassified Marinomonas]KJZ15475.1 hypothetical protein TW85_05020 [Marinomonas sp. S3726]KZM39829.1 hypothetical protein OA92_19080 [Marinomonas sp. SBI22]KZM41205.1 hypothetical protein OA91_18315 [Marinomonas sp. SBI8L]